MTGTDNNAQLDPWCVVELEGGTRILFGFAVIHRETTGLAWLSSSQLLELDCAAEYALTRSGTRYLLGRRFEPVDVGGEGEEARLAFDMLIGARFGGANELSEVDRLWLMSRKAARHLAIEPPARTEKGTREFFEKHTEAYLAIRLHGRRLVH